MCENRGWSWNSTTCIGRRRTVIECVGFSKGLIGYERSSSNKHGYIDIGKDRVKEAFSNEFGDFISFVGAPNRFSAVGFENKEKVVVDPFQDCDKVEKPKEERLSWGPKKFISKDFLCLQITKKKKS